MQAGLDIGVIASSRHSIREPFAGGLEAHTHALAMRLRRRGHRVTVYASACSDPALGVRPVCREASRLDLSEAARRDPSMLARPFLEDHHAYLQLMLDLRDTAHDVLHNNSLHYLPVAMADAVERPIVTTLHTPPTPWIESAVGVVRRRERRPCFAAVSRTTARAWRHAIDVDRVIPNGIDLEAWPFVADPEGDYAVWTGRIVPEKGTHLAIEAARAAGMPLILAGPIGDRHYWRAEVQPRLHAGCEYAGHLGGRDLKELVADARVALVTPCWDEPYGLVVAEALACGTPVAAFDRGAVGEITDPSCGRLAPPGDVDGLAAAALVAARLDRGAARRRAERTCSLDAMVSGYERLYRELA